MRVNESMMPEPHTTPCAVRAILMAQLCQVLRDAAAFVGRLETSVYRHTHKRYYPSSIGAHMRHVVEHTASLLELLHQPGVLDYDQRARCLQLETDPAHLLALIEQQCQQLAELTRVDPAPAVQYRSGQLPASAAPVLSSVERELEFLLSHTVHHLALVAMIARLQGVDVPDTLGLAPATQRYRQQCQPAAKDS